MKAKEEPVLFDEQIIAKRGVGVVTLNRPEALNTLTREMLAQIEDRLKRWEQRDDIACLFFEGAGERAFCAGGDVKSLVQEGVSDFTQFEEFFYQEYSLDYYVHTYKKPIVAWLDGITMGGGMGLTNGASVCVVTERSLLAMPEITIGFFPDVGASYFYAKIPEGLGTFLGLTAGRLNGREAVALGLAHGFFPSGQKRWLWEQLLKLPWTSDDGENHRLLNEWVVKNKVSPERMDAPFLSQQGLVEKIAQQTNFSDLHEYLLSLKNETPYLDQCIDRYEKGSPTSARVIVEQFQRNRNLSLPDVFAKEWDMALEFCHRPDFAEGVRALLVDKDQTPLWQPQNYDEVQGLAKFFTDREGNPFRQGSLKCGKRN